MDITITIVAALKDPKNADWVDLNDWAVNTAREIADKQGWSRAEVSSRMTQEVAFQTGRVSASEEGYMDMLKLRRLGVVVQGASMRRCPRLFKKAAFVVWVSRRELGY